MDEERIDRALRILANHPGDPHLAFIDEMGGLRVIRYQRVIGIYDDGVSADDFVADVLSAAHG